MTPEEQQALKHHVQEIAKILYKNAEQTRMTNLAEIEAVVRAQVQQHVSPEVGLFLLQQLQTPMPGIPDDSKVSWEKD